jgi:hypothetical protein
MKLPRIQPFLVTCLAVAFLAVVPSLRAQKQMIVGTVIDDATRLPIADALVTLVDIYDRPQGRAVRADSVGGFTITVTRAGWYKMKSQRLGYLPVTTARFNIAEDELHKYQIWMSAQIYILAPLTIVEKPVAIFNKLEGFEWRKSHNSGFFMDREDIVQRGPVQATDLLTGIAGVRIQYDGFAASIRMIRGSSECSPVVYLDGLKVRIDPVETLNQLDPQFLHGVEVYKGPSQIPGEFAGSDASCGVVVIWTRRGG